MTRHRIAALVFLQMLPATLVAPAVRPLFAAHHAGREGPMHAFMALNMLGAIALVPLVTRWARRRDPRALLVALALVDAVLLTLIGLPLPTWEVLALRTAEGGAHVGAATILFAEAVRRRQELGCRRSVPLAGAALMSAIVLGSAAGGALVQRHVSAPFFAASALLVLVAFASTLSPFAARAPAAASIFTAALARRLWVPIGTAFFGRFTVGCLVVTFSLYAHRVHGLDDRSVGALFSMMTLPFAAGMYPAGRIAEGRSRAAVLLAGLIVYAAAIAALPAAPRSALAPVMLVIGVGSALLFSPTLCYSATLARADERTSAVAMVNAAGCFGMLVGPAVAGITSAIVRARAPFDAGAPYRAVFVLAAVSVAAWALVAMRWVLRALASELRDGAPTR